MSLAIDDLKIFLEKAPTPWHAVKEMGMRLAQHDFSPLDEKERWELEKGKGYFVIRGGSFIAFRTPKNTLEKTLLLASHTDSPAMKLKPSPVTQKDNMTFLGGEVYGAPLISSWLNRDLCLAGKVMVSTHEGKIEEHLVHLKDTCLTIPQLAIHLDREVNEKGAIFNKQEHLKALVGLGLGPDWTIEKLLKKTLSFSSLLSFDLFLVPTEPAQKIGLSEEMIASYRIDNLASAHASITSLASIEASSCTLQLVFSASHEEIGSKTEGGAYGSFLKDVLTRIFASYHLDEEDRMRALAKSFCVSLDMAHAFHPSYEGRYEPNHRPLLGKGVVIKYNADSKYATTSYGSAIIKSACMECGAPHQEFVARSDMGCGSTIGPIIAHTLGVTTADVGIPQLSMHSSREVMGSADYNHLCALLLQLLHHEKF